MASPNVRRCTHDVPVNIRISGSLLGRVEKAAIREGVTRSEFLRTALRRELEVAAA